MATGTNPSKVKVDLSDVTAKPRSGGVTVGAMLGRGHVDAEPKSAVAQQALAANSPEAQENRRLKLQIDEFSSSAHDSRLRAEKAEAEKVKAVAIAAQFDGALAVRALDSASIRRSQWANRNVDEFSSSEFFVLREEIKNAGGNTQPIKVRKIPLVDGQPGKPGVLVEYEIVFGHRRFEACKLEGLPVNAIIAESMTDQELFEAMERENRGRKNLSAWEQGRMYQDALDKGLYASGRKLEEALNINHQVCAQALQLAKLPTDIVKAFATPLDLQYRWAKPLTDSVVAKPDVVLAEAKKISADRKAGSVLAGVDVFNRLVGIEPAKAVPHVIKVSGGKTFTRIEKGGQISYQFEKLEKSKRDQIEKYIKEVLAR